MKEIVRLTISEVAEETYCEALGFRKLVQFVDGQLVGFCGKEILYLDRFHKIKCLFISISFGFLISFLEKCKDDHLPSVFN